MTATYLIESPSPHAGKTLTVDHQQQCIVIHDSTGALVGSMPWGAIIDRLLSPGEEGESAHVRQHARAPLALKVRYGTPGGAQCEGLTGGVGGGGVFIETSDPLPQGTTLTVEFSLPHRPAQQIKAVGTVAWTRRKAERQVLFPGMGLTFTQIDQQAQQDLIELTESLNRARQSSRPL